MEYNYEDYGLSYKIKNAIEEKIRQAEKKLESEPKEALEILHQIEPTINQALDYKQQRQEAKEKAEAAINKHYQICPLCGQTIEGGRCANAEHDIERIDFAVDEDGYEIGPAILSQITTEDEKIIAQLRVSDGNDGRYYGEVYILKGEQIENGWRGEPFITIKFNDFGKILSPEEAIKRKERIEAARREKELAEVRARYQEDSEYAERQVKDGYWRVGKFKKGKHPKTGAEQWEITLRNGDRVITYVADRYDRQPTSENLEYFYEEKRTLVNLGKIQVILVGLKEPFPENKPEPEATGKEPDKKEVLSAADLKASLEKLKQKFSGAK